MPVRAGKKPRRSCKAGIERGELKADIDLEVAVDALYGPIYYRMLVPVGPIDDDWVRSLARHVMAGLLA